MPGNFFEGSSSGRTTGSGPVNLGSNPSPSAKAFKGFMSFLINPFVYLQIRE